MISLIQRLLKAASTKKAEPVTPTPAPGGKHQYVYHLINDLDAETKEGTLWADNDVAALKRISFQWLTGNKRNYKVVWISRDNQKLPLAYWRVCPSPVVGEMFRFDGRGYMIGSVDPITPKSSGKSNTPALKPVVVSPPTATTYKDGGFL